MAVHGMIIDHANGLHEGVEDNGADKFEAAFFEVLGNLFRQFGLAFSV